MKPSDKTIARMLREQERAKAAADLERVIEAAETEGGVSPLVTSMARVLFGVLSRNDHVLANVAHNALLPKGKKR